MMRTHWLLGSDDTCSLINTEESKSPVSRNDTDRTRASSAVPSSKEDLEMRGIPAFPY